MRKKGEEGGATVQCQPTEGERGAEAGGRELRQGGREGGGSLGGGGVRPCHQVEAFKWPKCDPPLLLGVYLAIFTTKSGLYINR